MGRAQRNPSPAKHPAAMKFGLASARARASAARQLPVRAHAVAGVTAGKFLQVILVLRFGLPEIAGRFDLRHRLARPQAGGVDVGDGVAGHALLPGRGEEDRRTVRGAKVVALAVPRRRVRSEEHTSELQSLMRLSYAVF